MRNVRPWAAALILAVATSIAGAPDASACAGAVGYAISERHRALGQAQMALERGDYAEARSIAEPVVRASEAERDEVERAEWLVAMSYVRDPNASAAKLAEAVKALRAIRSRRTLMDVTSAVDLGEALTRVPGGEEEARRLLDPLVRADLIGSPHAYAALFRIGGADLRLRTTALRRCRAMAHDKDLCTNGFINTTDEARWATRGFVALGVIMAGAILAMLALAVVRVRRRAARLAAFA